MDEGERQIAPFLRFKSRQELHISRFLLVRASFIAGFLAVGIHGAQALSVLAPTPSQQLATVADRYIDGTFDLNPITATWSGEARYAGKFVDNLTAEHRAKERELNADTLGYLKQIDVQKLAAAEKLTYAALKYRATIALEEQDYDFRLMPFNQFRSVALTLVQFASTEGSQPFNTVVDYEAFLQRLEGFPGWVDSAIANMREGIKKQIVQPKILMSRTLAQLKSQAVTDPTLSGFYVPVKKFPASFAEADRVRLTAAYRKIIEEKISPAFTRLHAFVEKEYLPHCRDAAGMSAIPGGAAMYAFRVRESTTTNLSPEEIHQTGLREVARIRGEMELVRKQVAFDGNLNAFLASISKNPELKPFKSEAEVFAAYRKIQLRVEPQLDKLFSRKPRAALDIRPEPEITRATAAAHYSIGSPDGSRPGAIYVPVSDATAYTTPIMTALFLHEGLPGHHFEASLAQESELSRFRRYTRFNAYGEGWGLYAESLGKEMGVYDDPYQYMGRLLLEMHRAVRLVVDTGMHAKGWTREKALEYSVENEGENIAYHVPEIERYMAIPGQALSYKTGELKIMEFRKRAEQKLGARFDIRAFHAELLKDGNLPLAVLEEKMNRWIDSQ